MALIATCLLIGCAASARGPSHDAWSKARSIAERYLVEKYAGQARIESEEPRLPFFFRVKGAPDTFGVLVAGDAVVAERGVDALGTYFAASRLIDDQLPRAEDMQLLVEFMAAFPPVEKPRSFVPRRSAQTALHPRLDYLDKGRARFVLYYRAGGDDVGDGDGARSLQEWTLRVDPGGPLVWTSAARQWDDAQGRFVDVDHAN